MIIQAYGLFWKRDEINWNPGHGKRGEFRLLGRQGNNVDSLQVADFRMQKGVYILYGNHGAFYAGLARKQTIGTRLKQHLSDEHKEEWDKFSWFGFHQVLSSQDKNSKLQKIKTEMAKTPVGPYQAIKELEAVLVKVVNLKNKADSHFSKATEWTQIRRDEVEKFLKKICNK